MRRQAHDGIHPPAAAQAAGDRPGRDGVRCRVGPPRRPRLAALGRHGGDVLVGAITTYVRAGEDNDEGALAGSRADERQKMLSLRSRALGWNFAMVAAFIGLTVAAAVKAVWWWPFLVILAVTGFAYLLGLS